MSNNNFQKGGKQPNHQGQQQQQQQQSAPPTAPASMDNANEAPQSGAPVNVVVDQAPAEEVAEAKALPVNASISLVYFEQVLSEYARDLAVGVPHVPANGAGVQARLYDTIIRLVNHFSYDDFLIAFDRLLMWVHNNRAGLTSPEQFFRFTEHLALATKDRETCLAMYNMLLVMANPNTRTKLATTINWDKTLSGAVTEEGRNRIMKFFGL